MSGSRAPALGPRQRSVQRGADVPEVIEGQEVALPGELVQDRARYGVVQETGVMRRDVAVGVSLPDVHGYLDRTQREAPVGGEQLEVLDRSRAGRARRPQ